jgi:hypothetical protein
MILSRKPQPSNVTAEACHVLIEPCQAADLRAASDVRAGGLFSVVDILISSLEA